MTGAQGCVCRHRAAPRHAPSPMFRVKHPHSHGAHMLASAGCTTKTPDSDGTLGEAAWPGISSRTVVRRPARYFLGRRRSDTHSVSRGRISGAFGPPDHTRHKLVLTTIRAAQLSDSRRAGSSPLERWPSIVRSSAGQRGTPAVPEERRRAGTEQGHRSATGSRRFAELPPNPRAPQFCDLRPQAARGRPPGRQGRCGGSAAGEPRRGTGT